VRWLLGIVVLLLVAAVTWPRPDAPDGAAGADGPRPSVAWRPGQPQLGVQLYWVDVPSDTTEVLRRKADRVLDHVVGLGANSLAISFPFFTETITANRVVVDERTPSPERLAAVVDEARRSGLRVSIRPLLDERNLVAADSRNWRGRLDPADRDAWFASYRDFLAPYLQMAQGHGVQTVIIGAELNVLQTDPRWADLVEDARRIYSGELGYAANWDSFGQAARSVPVDTVGIDAYPRLGLPATATAAQMQLAWRRWLQQTVPNAPGDVPLYELGAAAEAGTVTDPALPHTAGAPLDEGVQARWLGAACRAAQAHGLGGVYLWKMELDADPALADPVRDLHDSWVGRTAETALRQCFADWPAR
jgi:hypothetical protein